MLVDEELSLYSMPLHGQPRVYSLDVRQHIQALVHFQASPAELKLLFELQYICKIITSGQ
jgi:hypothetical protein